MAPGLLPCALGCALGALGVTNSQDDRAYLLQHSVSPQAEAQTSVHFAAFEQVVRDNRAREIVGMAPHLAEMMGYLSPRASRAALVEAGKEAAHGCHSTLARGWEYFFNRAWQSSNPDPHELLHTAWLALTETGAREEMKQLASFVVNASKGLLRRKMPMDSVIVGFKAPMVPWNDVLQHYPHSPTEATFKLFFNFFGLEGDATRLCVGASADADPGRTLHARSEPSGVSVFAGPAKWDNVPGWQFGASGGADDSRYFDVRDVGWGWTLASEPEPVSFHFDIGAIDGEAAHTPKQAQSHGRGEGDRQDSSAGTPARGSSPWIGHVWCMADGESV